MAFERDPVLLFTRDAPFLRRDLRMLAHAHSGRAIGDRRDVELDIGELQIGKPFDLLPQRSRLLESAKPVGEALREAELDPAHALHAADERQIARAAVDHSRGLDCRDHAGRARHHRRKCGDRRRHARIHQYFARDVAPRQIGSDGSPHRKIGCRAVQPTDHLAHHGNGKCDCVEPGEGAVDLRERRSHPRCKPDRGTPGDGRGHFKVGQNSVGIAPCL